MEEKDNQSKYSDKSAGKRMISNVPACAPRDKVSEIKEKIFSKAAELETINYVYVLEKGLLRGVFSLKEIFRREENETVESFMDKKIVKAGPFASQEKVASLAIKHNLKAIPIVAKNGVFLGVVPSDVILGILHEEHIEDIFLSAGFYKKDGFSSKIIEAPAGISAKMKLPWLIVGLFGGVVAAQLTGLFEAPLKSHFILAAFIPLVVYIAGAVGSQTQILYIRGLTINHFSQSKYFLREIKAGLLIALVLAFLIFAISLLLSRSMLIGYILSLSLFLIVLSSIVISILIPRLLLKAGKDPALGSGPFGTIIADMASLIIYFAIATALLKIWG